LPTMVGVPMLPAIIGMKNGGTAVSAGPN